MCKCTKGSLNDPIKMHDFVFKCKINVHLVKYSASTEIERVVFWFNLQLLHIHKNLNPELFPVAGKHSAVICVWACEWETHRKALWRPFINAKHLLHPVTRDASLYFRTNFWQCHELLSFPFFWETVAAQNGSGSLPAVKWLGN